MARNLYTAEMEYVALGSFCLPAALIEKAELRKASYPFDWVFASPEVVVHSLRTRFEEWLTPENVISHNPQRRAGHRKYDPIHFFNHHDPTQESDRDLYLRRITRFLGLYDSDAAITFVCIASQKSIEKSELLAELGQRRGISNLLSFSFYLDEYDFSEDFHCEFLNPRSAHLFIRVSKFIPEVKKGKSIRQYCFGVKVVDEEKERDLIKFLVRLNHNIANNPTLDWSEQIALSLRG